MLREQIFNRSDLIGYSTDSGSVIDTTLHNVMEMLGFFPKGPEVTAPVSYTHLTLPTILRV